MSMNAPKPDLTCLELIEKLREKQMNNEWTWSAYGLTIGNQKIYPADQLEIIYSQHFEDCSDAIGAKHIYVIKAENDLTGFCLDAAGTHADPADKAGFEEFISRIPVASPEDQLRFQAIMGGF